MHDIPAQLRDPDSILHDVFRLAPTFMAVLRGPTYVHEMANDAYYGVIGDREVIGKPLFEALPEVRGQGFEELLAGVVTTGEPFVGREVPVMIARTPGASLEERFVDFVYLPMTESDGTRSGIFVHGTDVTEHVRARREVERLLAESERTREELAVSNDQLQAQQIELEITNQQLQDNAVELEAQTEQLQATAAQLEEQAEYADIARKTIAAREQEIRTLANVIPTLAWTARADGYIDWYNARWYEYTGTTPEQMEGWGWQSVHDPATLPKVLEAWRNAIESRNEAEMTFPLRGGDGEFRRFLTRITPLKDADGGVVRWFGTNTDVEAERTAREAAEGANQAKTDFLANMSHELRTPLNAIGGYAELLDLGIHGPVTERQHEAISRIQRSQRHLLGLINDILNFAKLAAGHVEYHIIEVLVRDAFDAIEPLVAPQLSAKSLHFERDTCADREEGPIRVLADEDKLQQILVNLLSNAIKFTPAGGTVNLRCRHDDNLIFISVADTGIGIATDRVDQIFSPFVQIDRRLNAPHEGTGLGLSISRDLAQAMNGDLIVESELGAGSTFTVTLPRARSTASD
ncbi:MAG: ATP-binding protein [Gemmatimonadota bacterium]|nr:ATP-binding protein [Gemmatimonadota bacterium]